MRRYLALALVVGLGLTASLLPAPAQPSPQDVASGDAPAVAVCSLEEGISRSTQVAVLSNVNGEGRLTAFAAGGAIASSEFATGASGSTLLQAEDVAVVGQTGGLVELPDAGSRVGSQVGGAGSLGVSVCPVTPVRESVLAGGSTLSGERLELHLMNPYAGETVVSLEVVSESGVETNEALDTIIVPSRSSTIVDLHELLPGRERLSVTIQTISGSVIAVGRQFAAGDIALWNSVEAAQDWFVISPSGGTRRMTIASPGAGDVTYEVDVYALDGLEEAAIEGTITGRGMAVVDLADLPEGVIGFRVVATAPVAVFLRVDREPGVGLTAGVTVPANRIFLPGLNSSAGDIGRILILNPGTEDASVTVAERRLETTAEVFPVAPDSVVLYELSETPGDGVVIDSDMPVVAIGFDRRGQLISLLAGSPLADG